MALGDNIAFFNETTFGLGDEQTTTTGVSGLHYHPIAAGSAAKVVFNKLNSLATTPTALGAGVVGLSAKIGDVVYALNVNGAYHGEIISIVNEKRLSTQITVSSGTNLQTASAEGFNSVGPTLRRLHQLGYV
tara:strand:+ start:705 stop:1100 length:396 start_codon:yes stop_codon:yes gene_type:complete